MSDKLRYNLTDHLTSREVDDLMILFDKVKLDLSASSFQRELTGWRLWRT